MECRHVRLEDENGLVQRGGYTIGIQMDKENNGYRVSVAICSSKDLFCKKTGRTVVEKRLNDSNEHDFLALDDIKKIMVENMGIYFKGARAAIALSLIEALELEDISSSVIFDRIYEIIEYIS